MNIGQVTGVDRAKQADEVVPALRLVAEIEVELARRWVSVEGEVLEESNRDLGLVVADFDDELVRVVVSASLSRDL